ncbi:MAG: beta-ketoacyl-ACP synthase II [Campylobacteraceae bacterium]|jgi:3-oxoacyl-[acyl-carrier-protein] synthase II|nr:beta-ketoacyl-ACP synthase II [Campylobacteraceae bacterium]
MKKVVVTGVGMINGVGNSAKESFNAMVNGISGVDLITHFDASKDSVKIASEIKGFDPISIMDPKDIKKCDRFVHIGLYAIREALNDAKLNTSEFDCNRIGVCGATGIGGLPMIQTNAEKNFDDKKISPFFIPGTITNMLPGYASIYFNLKGPNLSSTTACTAGLHAITQAAKTIMIGGADVMVAVGSESTVCELGLRGFSTIKALSTRNDDPKTASRPFDKNRDGFVLGEGAAALILESYEHAVNRGAKIYAQISGFGESADAIHITSPDMNGPVRAMQAALKMAGLESVDYINAHGTSTPIGDANETRAIKKAFGDKVPPVSSIKGSTGHCLGATGAIEAVVSIMALDQNIIPPTINYCEADSECDLDYVPNIARKIELRDVLTTNYGFGGTNGAIIFSKIR